MKMLARTVVIMLVAANLAFAAWQVRHEEPQPLPFRPTDRGVAPLVLLNERNPLAIGRQRASNLEPASCYTLGPLPSQADARRIANALSEDTQAVRERLATATRERGYWVYLPAQTSRDDALGKARELASVGVRDYYVVTAGENENTISLGLFGQQDNALRRQASLRQMGFEAEVTIRYDERPEYWVDYAITLEQAPSWQPLVARYSNVSLEPIPCF